MIDLGIDLLYILFLQFLFIISTKKKVRAKVHLVH